MALTTKTVSGFRDVLFTDVSRKVEVATEEIRKEHPEYTEEEIVFQGHLKAFQNVRASSSKNYTLEEIRALVMANYFLTSPEMNVRMTQAVMDVISRYPQRSSALISKTAKDYSVQIQGRVYCKSDDSHSHCLIPNECIKGIAEIALPKYIAFIKGLTDQEVSDIIRTTVPFAKHENNKRTRTERTPFGDKSIMEFTSPETLKGYAVRQSVPLTLNILLQARLKNPAQTTSSDLNEQ